MTMYKSQPYAGTTPRPDSVVDWFVPQARRRLLDRFWIPNPEGAAHRDEFLSNGLGFRPRGARGGRRRPVSDIRRVVTVIRGARVYDSAAIYRALGMRPCCEPEPAEAR
jgi:hypothetical protein